MVVADTITVLGCSSLFNESITCYLCYLLHSFLLVYNCVPTIQVTVQEAKASVFIEESNDRSPFVAHFALEAKLNLRSSDISQLLIDSSLSKEHSVNANEVLCNYKHVLFSSELREILKD